MRRPLEPQPLDEARSHLFLAVQPLVAQEVLSPPVPLAPQQGASHGAPVEYVYATRLTMQRLLYLQVLAVLLVVLIAAAAAYAVFMRPLHDLVINSGALVLGVWGIRSILTPGTAYRTVVDMALSAVILFLLGAITFRALQFCYSHGELNLFGRPKPPGGTESPGVDED